MLKIGLLKTNQQHTNVLNKASLFETEAFLFLENYGSF